MPTIHHSRRLSSPPRRATPRPAAAAWTGVLLAAAAVAAGGASGRERAIVLREPELSTRLTDLYPGGAAAPEDPVQRAVFERINQDRAAAGLRPVAWDEEAARAAGDFCARQVAEKTRGHFLTDGVPPYARMSFAGVFGMHSENSVSWVTNAETFSDSPEKLALEGHADMMREKPPYDGHRQTILDPEATHVGVGYAVGHGRFQMAQEFLTRGLQTLSLTRLSGSLAGVVFDGRPLSKQVLRFVTVAWEPAPTHLTRQEASARTSYSYPNPRVSYIPEGLRLLQVVGTTSQDRLKIRTDHSFSFDFVPARPGLYSLVFYLSEGQTGPPRPGGSAVLWFE